MVVELNMMQNTRSMCSTYLKHNTDTSKIKVRQVNLANGKCENAGFMLMFRRKRTCLTKRLWKARIRKEHEIRSKDEVILHDKKGVMRNCGSYYIISEEYLLRNSVLKTLENNQLEMLVEAVESEGAGTTTCVLIPKDIIQEPHFLCCQLWRWPDLQSSSELRRTPACSSITDPVYICCNPYHWSRLCEPESSPPPYSRFSYGKVISKDCISINKDDMEYELAYRNRHHQVNHRSNPFYQQVIFRGSLSTNGESDVKENDWCKLAYWELSQRVGRLYSVQNTSINIFWTDAQADGLCLETLTQQNFSTTETVYKNRTKIGLGITLSKENDGIWVYNRSNCPVFVNSPSVDRPGHHAFLVYRVPSGHCFRVFNTKFSHQLPTYWNGPPIGPVDPNSVRISFAKGWGPNYHRQEITACPTWLEVLLSPCR